MMEIVTFFFGCVVLIGLASIMIIFLEDVFLSGNIGHKIAFLILIVGSSGHYLCDEYQKSQREENAIYGENIIAPLAGGVKLTEVPVKGQKEFQATVRITYKDGKLKSVALINNTTIPFANAGGR